MAPVFVFEKMSQIDNFCENSEICQNYHHSRSNITFWEFFYFSSSSSLLTGLLVEMVARRTLRRSSRNVIRKTKGCSSSKLVNLQASLQSSISSSPWEESHNCLARQGWGWMKKRQFWSTLSEGVELMTGFDWYNVAKKNCEKKMSPILVIIFLKILKSVKITAILVD